MGLREQAAVEQTKRFNSKSLSEGALLPIVAGKQFLRHRISEIMGKNVKTSNTQAAHKFLHHIGLVGDGVIVSTGFVGKTKPQKIRSDKMKASFQSRPYFVPVPGSRRESVQKE